MSHFVTRKNNISVNVNYRLRGNKDANSIGKNSAESCVFARELRSAINFSDNVFKLSKYICVNELAEFFIKLCYKILLKYVHYF